MGRYFSVQGHVVNRALVKVKHTAHLNAENQEFMDLWREAHLDIEQLTLADHVTRELLRVGLDLNAK